jgi:uncharacterized protein YhbP (UPF0306 family)
MAITRSTRPTSATRIVRAARRLLDASTLCAIATVSPGGRAHVNTAYFAWTDVFEIVWLSERRARHSLNLRADPRAAIAVYDSTQTWGGSDRGIQLFGSAREATGRSSRDAERAYAGRFSAYEAVDVQGYALYRFRPQRIKVFDEGSFGGGVFVTARVDREGRITWERTEVYRPDR